MTHLARVVAGSVELRRLAKELRADVLYANGTRGVPYAIGARALGGPPLLFHHHGLLSAGPVRTLVRAVDRFVDALVVPSKICAQPFSLTDKIHIIPNGIDLDRFLPDHDRDGARRTFGIPPDARVVATVTRADPSKGMSEFLDLTETLRDQADVWFLLGGGPAFPHEIAPYATIRERAKTVSERLVLPGRLDDVVPAYRAADVFVHLGAPEVQPLAVIEAMASGLPVVAYDWGAMAEVVGDAGRLVAAGRLADASDVVRELLDDEDARNEAGARGRQLSEERYAIDRTANAISRVIASLVQ